MNSEKELGTPPSNVSNEGHCRAALGPSGGSFPWGHGRERVVKLQRSRRVIGGVAVALATLVAWDQSGLMSAAAPNDDRPVEVAGVSQTLAGGPGALGERLRVPDTLPPPPPVAEEAPSPLSTSPTSTSTSTSTRAPVVIVPRGGDKAITPPPTTFDKSAKPARQAPPPAMLQASNVTPTGGTWAVLIGVNDYPGTSYDLRSAVNDVNDVDAALAKIGVTADRRLLLRDGQATASTIRQAVDWLNAHASADATAVFFFAGHVRKVSDGTEALVGADGEMVLDTELAGQLEGLRANQAWIGIAACYAGGFTEVVRPGRILTAAAPADSLAYENERLGRSYLVEYMVRRAMLERGLTTIEAAFSFATAELKRDHPNRLPVQQDQVSGELDLRPPPPPRPMSAPSGGGTPEPAPRGDGCADLSVGVVRCGD